MLNPILLQLAQEKVAIRKDEGPQPPPNYRMAFAEVAKCQSCKHYNGGHCKKFHVPVDPNFVCDEYEVIDLDLPTPAAIDPGAGADLGTGISLSDVAPVSEGAGVVKLSTDGLDSITPQIDHGPVVAAPLKSNKRTESGSPNPSNDESAAAKDTYRHPEQPEHDVNNNPKATANIFGMHMKAAQGGGGGGAGGGAAGGGAASGTSGGMAAPSESTGVSSPQGYGPYPDQQQIHRLQVGFSGSRRKHCNPRDTICKAAGLMDHAADLGLSALGKVEEHWPQWMPSLMHAGTGAENIKLTDSPRLAAMKTIRDHIEHSGGPIGRKQRLLTGETGNFERGWMRDAANTQRLQQGLAAGGLGLAGLGLGYGAYRLGKRLFTPAKTEESQVEKGAGLAQPSINPSGLTPGIVKSMPNAAQSVPVPQARPLIGAQPGDPSMNPGPPAGPRGTPSQPTGQQGQASPTPPPQQQPAPQQPAPQGPAPSPLVTLYPEHPLVKTMSKFVPPAPPPDGGGQQKMAGEIDLEALATVAASVKAASDAPPAPPKPRSPVAPVPPSAPKKPCQPTIKAAKSISSPSQRSLTRKSLTGKAMQAKNLTPKALNKQGAAEERAGGALGNNDEYELTKSADGVVTATKSATVTITKSTGVHDENNARLGVAMTVTRSLPATQEKVARQTFSKRANVNVALPTLPFDPLSHDLTAPADPTALAASGGVGKQHGLMERAGASKGKHPGIKGKSPGRSTGFLDPATMAQVRQATSGARTALDLDIKPSAQSFFDPKRFQTLAQMASVGDARAYTQMQEMAKSLEATGTDPYTARMAQSRLQDLELQHPQFAKTSQVLDLAEEASKNLLGKEAMNRGGVNWEKLIGGPFNPATHQSLSPRIKSTAPPPAAPAPVDTSTPLAALVDRLFTKRKPSITSMVQQLQQAGGAPAPQVNRQAGTVAYKVPPAEKLANVIKSAQGYGYPYRGVHPDPRVRLQQQQQMAARNQGAQSTVNNAAAAGEPGSTQAGPPTEDQAMQQKYQQLRQSGRMPRNMTYDRWAKSWQASGDRLAKAEAERQANPELQRRPEEAGAAGFEAWQARRMQHRQNLKQMTPEEAKQMERQPNESQESWTNRRGNIAAGLGSSQQNRAQQVTNRQGIMNVQGRVNAMTPEQKTQMADAETMRALQGQGMTPEQARAKMQQMTPEQRGQMNEQAAQNQANTYNQMEEARRAHEAKTPEQLADEEQTGQFNAWQNYATKEMAKAMGMDQLPTNMTPQQFQQQFQQMQQAGQLHDPEVMGRLQEHYKSMGYHGQMPSVTQDYNKQTWTAMNTPAQQGGAPATAGAQPAATPPQAAAPPAATPPAAQQPEQAPMPTAQPTTGQAGGAAPPPGNANTATPTTTAPTTTATNPTSAPTGTGGTNTGGATNASTNANANAPKADSKKPTGGFSVGSNPSPSPGSEAGKTPYS